jgi:hypothetical protein
MTKGWVSQAATAAIGEMRIQLASLTWRLTLVAAVVLGCLTTAVNHQHLIRRQAEVQPFAAERDRAAADGRGLIADFRTEVALRVIREPQVMSVLVAGLDLHSAPYWDMGPEGSSVGREAAGERLLSTNGVEFDLEFGLRVLVGLLAVVVGATSMFAARYRHTAKTVICLPIHPSAFVVGGLVGGWVAVGLAALAVVGSSTGVLLALGPDLLTTQLLKVVAAIWCVATIYGAALQGLGAAIALIARRTASVIASATSLWLVLSLIGSVGLGALVWAAHPVTSRALFELQRNAFYTEAVQRIAIDAGLLINANLGAVSSADLKDLSPTLRRAIDDHWDRALPVLRTRLGDLEHAFRRSESTQEAWASRLATPLSGPVFRRAVMELTGVGRAAADRWAIGVADYQSRLNAELFDRRRRLFVQVSSGRGSGYIELFRDRGPRPTRQDLPQFVPPVASFSSQLGDAAPWIALLGLHWLIAWSVTIALFVSKRAVNGYLT